MHGETLKIKSEIHVCSTSFKYVTIHFVPYLSKYGVNAFISVTSVSDARITPMKTKGQVKVAK
jgi:hypothetical protein